MIKQIIKADPKTSPSNGYYDNDALCLHISEFFYDAIQGEGITTGYPAAFLRLSGCTLDCSYCDTKSIRNSGNTYTYTELFNLMDKFDIIPKFRSGQHLVITGGSPLKQLINLIGFLETFIKEYGFKPFIELENECTIMPGVDLIRMVDQWNNSPKLNNSMNPYHLRHKSSTLKMLSCLKNSWFKFVICAAEADWKEILTDYITPKLILKEQIILMPQGKTRKEILKNSPAVIDLAVRENVRFSLREHIILWDNKIGV